MDMTWEEQLRSDGWKFEMYRTRQWWGQIDDDDVEAFRIAWQNRLLPRPGAFRRDRRRRPPPRRRPVGGRLRRPSLFGLMPRVDGERETWEQVRDDYRKAQAYFHDNPRELSLVGALGFGGNGLVIKCEYRRNMLAPVLTFVMKIALYRWDAPELYEEEITTENFSRAAHIVQIIPRSKVGMPPRERHVLHQNLGWDDSSTDEDDSGDESCGDVPTAKVKLNAAKSRRQQRATQRRADPDAFEAWMRERTRRYQNRVELATKLADRREREMTKPNPRPRFQVDRKDFMLLEFLENGDLESLLKRLSHQGKDIPNRVLWSFWLCLTQACLAMQYPPRKFHPGRHEDHPILKPDGSPDYDVSPLTGKRVGDDLFEQEPAPRRRWAVKRFVHFDIDVRNVLIGGLEVGVAGDNEHVLVPRLKLADFGLGSTVKPNKRNIYYKNMRNNGKWGHYAPEQFGAEWDHIKKRGGNNELIEESGDEICEQPVAGNYGSHTNVFCVALTMWQLITKQRAPQPPDLQLSRVAQSQMPNHYGIDILTEPEYNRVDRNLRETVAKCLAHEPKNRPEPRTLVREAKRVLRRRVPGEPDDAIRQWVQDVLFNPPPDNPPRQAARASAPAGPRARIPPFPPIGGSAP